MSSNSHHIIIDSSKNSGADLREVYRFKDLFFTLSYRDLRIRYSQTFLGLVWAFLQPAATLLVITLVFGRFVQVNTGNIPYPLFSMAGISLWIYFSFVMSQSGNSIINAQEMVKKIYFPRIIIPLSKAMVGLVDLIVALLLMICLFIYYGFTPSSQIYLFPVFIFLTLITSLAVGIWLSALTIRYRDFQYIVPFMIQFGLYLTPVAYPTELVMKLLPEWAKILYYFNPMAGIIEGFRWTLFGGIAPSGYFWISMSIVFILFFGSIRYFQKVDRKIPDLV